MVTGRMDPQRRERILAATLDLIAEEGIAYVSHRKVAARRCPTGLDDVPLHRHGRVAPGGVPDHPRMDAP